MYNLFIGYIGPEDEENEIRVSAARFLEYTDSETQMRYRDLNSETVRELKSYPAIFMHEHYQDGAFIANIINITQSDREYLITFERNQNNVIQSSDIERLALELDISEFEFYRTHWAVKNCDLLGILEDNNVQTTGIMVQLSNVPQNNPAVGDSSFNNNQIFIVHGHDEHAKNDVKEYVESKGFEPIILHLQASGGRTIIEKIDHYSNVGFAIILYTECDIGAKRDTLNYKWRARQNVIFEHGYLIAKLSRSRVAALVKGDIETPNDISGVVYVTMDAAGSWKTELDAELQNSQYIINNS